MTTTQDLPSHIITKIMSYDMFDFDRDNYEPNNQILSLYCYKKGDSDRTLFCFRTSVFVLYSLDHYCFCDVSYLKMYNIEYDEHSWKQFCSRVARLCSDKKRRFVPKVLCLNLLVGDVIPPKTTIMIDSDYQMHGNLNQFVRQYKDIIESNKFIGGKFTVHVSSTEVGDLGNIVPWSVLRKKIDINSVIDDIILDQNRSLAFLTSRIHLGQMANFDDKQVETFIKDTSLTLRQLYFNSVTKAWRLPLFTFKNLHTLVLYNVEDRIFNVQDHVFRDVSLYNITVCSNSFKNINDTTALDAFLDALKEVKCINHLDIGIDKEDVVYKLEKWLHTFGACDTIESMSITLEYEKSLDLPALIHKHCAHKKMEICYLIDYGHFRYESKRIIKLHDELVQMIVNTYKLAPKAFIYPVITGGMDNDTYNYFLEMITRDCDRQIYEYDKSVKYPEQLQ